jgi:hypothetical protein
VLASNNSQEEKRIAGSARGWMAFQGRGIPDSLYLHGRVFHIQWLATKRGISQLSCAFLSENAGLRDFDQKGSIKKGIAGTAWKGCHDSAKYF